MWITVISVYKGSFWTVPNSTSPLWSLGYKRWEPRHQGKSPHLTMRDKNQQGTFKKCWKDFRCSRPLSFQWEWLRSSWVFLRLLPRSVTLSDPHHQRNFAPALSDSVCPEVFRPEGQHTGISNCLSWCWTAFLSPHLPSAAFSAFSSGVLRLFCSEYDSLNL